MNGVDATNRENAGAVGCSPGIYLREHVTASDMDRVRRIVMSSGFFSAAEVEVAVELVTEHLQRGPASGYYFLFADAVGLGDSVAQGAPDTKAVLKCNAEAPQTADRPQKPMVSQDVVTAPGEAANRSPTIAYACYGPIACTVGSFDLYWIAVEHGHRRHGLGRLLLDAVEQRVGASGGRRIYIETSSRPQYAPTRTFYERCGYRKEATLPDFYAPGDAKITYTRTISRA